MVSIVFCYPKNPDPSPPLHWRVQWFLEADWGWKLFEIPTTVYSGCRVFGGGFKPNLLFFWLVLMHLMVHVPPEITKHQHLNHSICFFHGNPSDRITQRSTTKAQPSKNQHQHTRSHKNKHYHKTQPQKNNTNPHTKNIKKLPQNTPSHKNTPTPFFFRDSKGLLFCRESAVEQCWLDTTHLLVHLGIGSHLWYHQGTTGPESDMNGWPLWKWGKYTLRYSNWVVVSNIFLFSPLLGEDSHVETTNQVT